MKHERFVVLDTETTGLSSKTERVIEIGVIEFDPETGLLGERFHTYLNPPRDIDPKAFEAHGITKNFLKGKPQFTEVASALIAFLKGATVVAHNAPFDVRFMNMEFRLAGLPALEEFVPKVICTKSLAQKMNPGLSVSLDNLCDVYGVSRSKRKVHGALVDCELLAELYARLARGPASQFNLELITQKAAKPVQRLAVKDESSLVQRFISSFMRYFHLVQ